MQNILMFYFYWSYIYDTPIILSLQVVTYPQVDYCNVISKMIPYKYGNKNI